MIHHQEIARVQVHRKITHALTQRAIQRHQQLQPFMPGQALRNRPVAELKQLDHKRKFPWQFQLMAAFRIQQMCDAMGAEVQLAGNRQ